LSEKQVSNFSDQHNLLWNRAPGSGQSAENWSTVLVRWMKNIHYAYRFADKRNWTAEQQFGKVQGGSGSNLLNEDVLSA